MKKNGLLGMMFLISGIALAFAFTVLPLASCDNGYSNNSKKDTNDGSKTPTAADFNISGTGAFTYDGTAKTVTVTAKEGKTTGAITVKYNGNAAAPSAVGTYPVVFDVAAATGWKKASELSAGTLTISHAQFKQNTHAQQLVANIKIGWNLGNTFDAAPGGETSWGNPKTTKANIDALKNAGFNAIRIPVTWYKSVAAGGAPNYTIRSDWMERVTEVVDYAVANDMYILLNTHHDEDIFKFTNAEKAASLNAFKKIWEQIADNFKDYNEKLVFEGLNEPRTKGSTGEWNGGTAEERANLNEHYQVFVNTVRASGGNNGLRMLMINTYAASAAAAAINGLVLPTDTVADRLIVSIHAYAPNGFALEADQTKNTWSESNPSDTSPITDAIDRAYNKFVINGIPVIMGEFGAMNKNNESVRAKWAQFYVSYAGSKGIKCVWWDNGLTQSSDPKAELFGLLDRNTNIFVYPDLLKGLMDGTKTSFDGGSGPITVTFERSTGTGYDNWQGLCNIPLSASGGKITSGASYTLTYSFKSNVAITGSLSAALVDNSETATPQWWNELSGTQTVKTNISANTDVTGTVNFTANGTASSAESAANKMVFRVPASGAASAPTLTFSSFSLVKN